MRVVRTLPPAAAPIFLGDLISGLQGFIKGARQIERFESELRQFFGVKYCFTVSSGKAALFAILRALRAFHEGRDEVLIPAYTCPSVPSAIVRAGLKVRLSDIDPRTLDYDFDKLPQTLSFGSEEVDGLEVSRRQRRGAPDRGGNRRRRLLAAIGIHLFGLPADVEKLREFIDDHAVTIVEDAAQAMGGSWKGRKLGTLGDVGFFSLGRGKALSAVEGGVIVTNRDDIAVEIRREIKFLPRPGMAALLSVMLKAVTLAIFLSPSLFWLPSSVPFLRLGKTIYDPGFRTRRLSAFQAGLFGNWQEKLMKLQNARRRNVFRLIELLGLRQFKHLDSHASDNPDLVRLPVRAKDTMHARETLRASRRYGMGIMPGYPDSIDSIPELRKDFLNQTFPAAKDQAERLVTVPIHSYLKEEDLHSIARTLLGTVEE